MQTPRLMQGEIPSTRYFLLKADGTEALVAQGSWNGGASLSPDGSQVVYSGTSLSPDGSQGPLAAGIYVVETDGGRPHLLLTGKREWDSRVKAYERPTPFSPAFSPDGRKIAYFDGAGDWGNGLSVMNADGSHVRELIDNEAVPALEDHPSSLVWSPDGSRLAFETDGGIWVVGADGSGLIKVSSRGAFPTWSPEGSRIAYGTPFGRLWIADADGTHVQKFLHRGPGSWNPVEPSNG